MKYKDFYEKFQGGFYWNRCIYKINQEYVECLYREIWYKKDRVSIGRMIQTLSKKGVILHTPEKFFNKVYTYGCDVNQEGFLTKKVYIKYGELIDLKWRRRGETVESNYHWMTRQISLGDTEFVRLENLVGITFENKKKIANNNSYSRNSKINTFLFAVKLNYRNKNFETKSEEEVEEWVESWRKKLTEDN